MKCKQVRKYIYKLEDIDLAGVKSFHHEISVLVPENTENQTMEFKLKSLYPNPFNPTLSIEYQLPEKGLINISIYDLKGAKSQRDFKYYKKMQGIILLIGMHLKIHQDYILLR